MMRKPTRELALPLLMVLAAASFLSFIIGSVPETRAEKTKDGPFPAFWLDCKQDQDCVVVEGICGDWDCVNRSAAKELYEINRKMEKEYGCGMRGIGHFGAISTPTSEKKPKPSASCTPKGCKCIQPTPTPKPDGRW